MKSDPSIQRRLRGFTLIEMTVVISVLIALMSTGIFFYSAIENWKSGREASEVLRSAYVAQRSYLADNPTATISSLTHAKLLPYLPTGETTFPTAASLEGDELAIKVSVSPPVVVNASGVTYDPSNNPNDSLWDVGE